VSGRHVQLLTLLLDEGNLTLAELTRRTAHIYLVKNPTKALVRDLNYLISLQAITHERLDGPRGFILRINLEWPAQITETEFFRRVKEMPKGKVHGFLSS
jgi:hypothetical protein